jgi:hypothetical protein
MKINVAILISRLLNNQSKTDLQNTNLEMFHGMMIETKEIIDNIMLVVTDEGVMVDYHELLNEMLTMRSGLERLGNEGQFMYGCHAALAIAIKELMAMQGTTKEANE